MERLLRMGNSIDMILIRRINLSRIWFLEVKCFKIGERNGDSDIV
jgi:hypothetical protein